jgi:hypothetical protein
MASSSSTPESERRAIQARLAEAVSAYAACAVDGDEFPPFPDEVDVSETHVALAAAAMLKQAGIYSFELATMFNV